MKSLLLLTLSTLTLLAASPRLDNVHAIWSGGSIIISWPYSGPGVYQVRRLVNGHREITFTLSDTQLAHLVDNRLSYTDSVAINVGEISYQVRKRSDTGNKGVWSKPAVEENKPPLDAISPSSSPVPPLTTPTPLSIPPRAYRPAWHGKALSKPGASEAPHPQ